MMWPVDWLLLLLLLLLLLAACSMSAICVQCILVVYDWVWFVKLVLFRLGVSKLTCWLAGTLMS
jgi:hypothetical protein